MAQKNKPAKKLKKINQRKVAKQQRKQQAGKTTDYEKKKKRHALSEKSVKSAKKQSPVNLVNKSSDKRVVFDKQLIKEATPGSSKPEPTDGEQSHGPTPKRSILKSRKRAHPKDILEINAAPEVEDEALTSTASVAKKSKLTSGKEKAAALNAMKSQVARTALLKRKDLRDRKRAIRLKKRPHYGLALKAIKIWESVRNRKISKDKKEELINSLYGMVAGKAKELIYMHDSVRVIQCLMAVKEGDIRDKLFQELKEEIIPMSKSKYARFFVVKMLKYGTPSQRDFIMDKFSGSVVSLMRHNHSSEVIEYAYNNYARHLQRTKMIFEFCGAEFAHFQPETVQSVAGYLTANPTKKEAVLKALKNNIIAISTKTSLKHTLIHAVCYEYFTSAPEDSSDVIDALKERLVEIAHTRHGALTAMHCVWRGSVRERKTIVKNLKTFVAKLACEEYGHLVLLAIFDSLDDTVLVNNVIIKELKKNLKTLIENKHGLRVLCYLLARRHSMFCPPWLTKILADGDGNTVSKKETDVRAAELRKAISTPLVEYLAEEPTMRTVILDPHSALFVWMIAKYADCDIEPLYDGIAAVAADDFVPCKDESYHLVEHPQSHFAIKQILQMDPERLAGGKVTLSSKLAAMSDDKLRSWTACNKGCFVLVRIIESGVPGIKEKIQTAVDSARKRLTSYSFAGAKMLLSKTK